MGYQTIGGEGGVGPISKLYNNKQQSLGPDWSMSEVGTPSPHNLDKPHRLVASNNNNNSHDTILLAALITNMIDMN